MKGLLRRVIFVALYCSLQVTMCSCMERNRNGEDSELRDRSTELRKKRAGSIALAALGIKAWRKLTNGATRLKPTMPNVNEFEKKGDFLVAERHFWSVDPQNVRPLSKTEVPGSKKPLGIIGQAGDRTIDLVSSGSGEPIIRIYKTHDRNPNKVIDIIKYKSDPY